MDAFLQVGGFLEIFAEYNVAIWPMQVVAYLLGVVAIFLVIKKTGYSNRVISAILAFYWLWVGILLCIVYWSRIYPGAYVYGILFIIQGVLFLAFGVIKPRISFGFKPNTYFILGLIIVLYAMIGYPIIGSLFGRVYPRSLSFGLVPCPTVVFTFGLFLWTDKKLPKCMLVIPFIFAITGVMAIFVNIPEDIGLVIMGVLATVLIFVRDKKMQ